MNKHEIALAYVLRANKILETLFLITIKNSTASGTLESQEFITFVQVIATSYHNTGVEYEHLEEYDRTLKFYLLAFSVTNKYLGAQHPLCSMFQQSFLQMKQKQENEKKPDRQELIHKALIKGKVNPKL